MDNIALLYYRLVLARDTLNTVVHSSYKRGSEARPILPHARKGDLELAQIALTNLIGLLRHDRKMVSPITLQALPHLSKCFVWAPYMK